MNCNADTTANELFVSLTSDVDVTIPDIDLSGQDFQFPSGSMDHTVNSISIASVTDGSIEGPGVFDTLMRGYKAHLTAEFQANRITGDDYTKAYIALAESAMNQGIAFLLGKDQSFWQSILTQAQAFTARVQIEESKVRLAAAQFEASHQKANYALTKMKTATEEVTYCSGVFTLENMLPQQTANLVSQGKMLDEQTEAQRSQTLDTRSDGTVVSGSVGMQKKLYGQQIVSYERNSELAAGKLFSDAWITQKTLDDGLLAPEMFQNASVNTVLQTIRTNNNLG